MKNQLKNSMILLFTLVFLGVGWIPIEKISEKKETQKKHKTFFNYDYDRGYIKGYSLGSTNNSSLFSTRYSTALTNDQFDYESRYVRWL